MQRYVDPRAVLKNKAEARAILDGAFLAYFNEFQGELRLRSDRQRMAFYALREMKKVYCSDGRRLSHMNSNQKLFEMRFYEFSKACGYVTVPV